MTYVKCEMNLLEGYADIKDHRRFYSVLGLVASSTLMARPPGTGMTKGAGRRGVSGIGGNKAAAPCLAN